MGAKVYFMEKKNFFSIAGLVVPVGIAVVGGLVWALWMLNAGIAKNAEAIAENRAILERLEKDNAEVRQWFITHISGGGHLQPSATVGAAAVGADGAAAKAEE